MKKKRQTRCHCQVGVFHSNKILILQIFFLPPDPLLLELTVSELEENIKELKQECRFFKEELIKEKMEKVKILERLNTLEEEMRSMKREVATNSGPQKDYSFNEPSMFYDEYPEYSPVVPPTQYTPQSQLFQTPPDPRYPPMSTTISPSVGSTPPASTPPAPLLHCCQAFQDNPCTFAINRD